MSQINHCLSRLQVCLLILSTLIPVILYAEQEVIIPFGDAGYRYQFVQPGSEKGFEKSEHRDTNFLNGKAGFGAKTTLCATDVIAPIQTEWISGKELLIRKAFVWDNDLRNLNLSVAVSGTVQVFINGNEISNGTLSNSGCPSTDSVQLTVPDEALTDGLNLLAVRVKPQTVQYFDLQLTGEAPGATIIPYLDTAYKYRFVKPGTGGGFQKLDFDDSSFRRGDAGFGSTDGRCPLNNSTAVKTIWPEKKDIQLRKYFELSSPESLRVSVAADNGAQVFVNGQDVSGGLRTKQSCGRRGDFTFVVPSSFLRKGRNLIAVLGRDFGGQRYVDLKVIIPIDTGQVVVPYLSSGYKYKIVQPNDLLGFEEPGFDDSSFNNGRAAFGSREGHCSLNNLAEVKTRWEGNNDILLRKFFDLGPNAQKLTVSVAIDNAARIFLNGVEITNGWINHSGCPRRTSFIVSAPKSILKNGENLIAVRARNFEGLNYIDIQVRAENP